MHSYEEWAAAYPEAAKQLSLVLTYQVERDGEGEESHALQQAQLDVAQQGALSWRNNVGALPAKTQHTCPRCNTRFEERQRPVRYGLANDSAKLNSRIKSSDLILGIPRVIRPEDVGRTICQLGGVEVKRPGWKYNGKGREPAQAAWLALLQSKGAFAIFSTGRVKL